VSGPSGSAWYTETGQGMGETLTIAAERGEYTLTDRGTWLEVANHAALPLLVEGDERLFNVYHVIVVNPERHDHRINVEGAQALRRFLAGLDDETLQRWLGTLDPQTTERLATWGGRQRRLRRGLGPEPEQPALLSGPPDQRR
jgi:ABC-type tungstate transport system permease subunit